MNERDALPAAPDIDSTERPKAKVMKAPPKHPGAGQLKRGGGFPGNRNATRHGLRAGALPKGASYIQRDTEILRRALEDAIALQNGGDVSLYHSALIQSACRWERHAMLAQRWLRLEAASMDAMTRLAYSRDIARASAERDRCLKMLGLDRDRHQSILDSLYSPTTRRIESNIGDSDRDSD